jgi:hypothetical protein
VRYYAVGLANNTEDSEESRASLFKIKPLKILKIEPQRSSETSMTLAVEILVND